MLSACSRTRRVRPHETRARRLRAGRPRARAQRLGRTAGSAALRCELHSLPRAERRRHPRSRAVAARRRRPRGGLLPPDGLHAARESAQPTAPQPSALLPAPARGARRLRRVVRRRPPHTEAASRPRQPGRRAGAVHRALRRLPPGRRQGRLRHERRRAGARRRAARRDRGSGTDRPLPDAALLVEADQRRGARLDHPLRHIREASRRPRRVGARPRRAGAGRPRRVVHRTRGDDRHVPRDREAAAVVKRWLIALAVLVLGRLRRRPRLDGEEQIVPPGQPDRRSENLVLLLFVCATLCAAAVPVVYAWDAIPNQTQFLGLALGLAFAFLSAASIVIGKRLVVTEENEEEYRTTHPDEEEALGAPLLTPAVSLGPVFDVPSLYRTPWRRGVRLVDEGGNTLPADDIEEATFYTAYPEHAD